MIQVLLGVPEQRPVLQVRQRAMVMVRLVVNRHTGPTAFIIAHPNIQSECSLSRQSINMLSLAGHLLAK